LARSKRDFFLSVDIFTILITNIVVGPAVVGDTRVWNVIWGLGVKIQASGSLQDIEELLGKPFLRNALQLVSRMT
jgi:hypothetical protein